MIFMPPRHGKSEMVTVRYAAWRLAIEPRMRIIIGCHNQRLANRFSRAIRRIDQGAASVSGKKSETTALLNRADEWETPEGGGVKAVGVGSGVTGFGADLIIIDDPVRSRAHAESTNNREKIWDWYSNDLHTRLEPNAGIVLIQTRWHEDDLAGRLIQASVEDGEKWDVISLPALAEADDSLGRKEGAALCHRRFPKGELEKKRTLLGSYSFASLYQQGRYRLTGMFNRAYFARIAAKAPQGLSWVRGYDLAVSTQTSADYTASFRCAMDSDGTLYISDGFRARVEYPEQRRYVLERLEAETETVHCVESALHGQALVQDIRKEVRAAPLRAVKTDKDKITRANLWLPIAEAGR
ncbi:MAG: hypothetical protein IPK98_19520 [Chloracidobacterium sp.]|nr:hypothetical protein [Chloracidobacterium sp.]